MERRISITSLITTVVPVRSLQYVLFLWMLIAIPLVVSGQTEEPKRIQKRSAFTVEVYGSGTPVYMIPGLASGGEVWQGTVERLKDRYECHVYTLLLIVAINLIYVEVLSNLRLYWRWIIHVGVSIVIAGFVAFEIRRRYNKEQQTIDPLIQEFESIKEGLE